VIGCVDSRKARKTILGSHAYWNSHYWLDLGNNASTGQFLLGQPENGKNKKCQMRLPAVAELFPEIVDPKLDRKDKLPSCSAVAALQRQEPFINQTVAYHALALLARLFRYGRLSHHGGFINLSRRSYVTASHRPNRLAAAPKAANHFVNLSLVHRSPDVDAREVGWLTWNPSLAWPSVFFCASDIRFSCLGAHAAPFGRP